MTDTKHYLGDGAFVSYDGSVILTTEDGLRETNRVVLEPEVLAFLLAWLWKQRIVTLEGDRPVVARTVLATLQSEADQ